MPDVSDALREYTRLLTRLHAAMGGNDEATADIIREQMDGPGERLTDYERDFAASLSAWLYEMDENPNYAKGG